MDWILAQGLVLFCFVFSVKFYRGNFGTIIFLKIEHGLWIKYVKFLDFKNCIVVIEENVHVLGKCLLKFLEIN